MEISNSKKLSFYLFIEVLLYAILLNNNTTLILQIFASTLFLAAISSLFFSRISRLAFALILLLQLIAYWKGTVESFHKEAAFFWQGYLGIKSVSLGLYFTVIRKNKGTRGPSVLIAIAGIALLTLTTFFRVRS